MRLWLARLAMVMVAIFAAPVAASEPLPLRSDCYAEAGRNESLSGVVADAARWRCGTGEPSLGAGRAVLRFSLAGTRSDIRYFGSRPSQFESVSLAVVRGGQVIAEQSYPAETLTVGRHGRLFLAGIPPFVGPADAVLVVFEKPSTRGLFSDARLFSSDPGLADGGMKVIIMMAMLCGMLLMPLAFYAAYYRVVRERFIVWHLVLSVSLLMQCLLSSGIVGHFIDLPVPLHARLSVLSFATGVAAAAAFGAAFIEPGKLDPRLRMALYATAVQVLLVSLFQALAPNVFGSAQTALYYASFVPLLTIFVWVLIDAWRRGSRAVRYQLVGWSPFMAVGVIRIATMLDPGVPQNEAMGLFYIAMVIESIATSLGVADRIMTIRKQRDRALIRAQSLEHLSERDDLTGLYNRRALDGRMGDFAQQRFSGFALFDLDNFKRVNDTHGHATGDAVLRTVAAVLTGHTDAVALRMGGEEFLLLLRGDRVAERVERLREAIPVRIAREVTALETLVTASVGLAEAAPGGDIGNDFVTLYRIADDLLYEAKHNGRNLLAAVTLDPATPASPAVAAA